MVALAIRWQVKMLKQRVVTAAILLVLFGLLLSFASRSFFTLAIAGVTAAAAWEWSRLAGVKTDVRQSVYAAAIGILTLAFTMNVPFNYDAYWLLLIAFLLWLVMIVALFIQPRLAPIESASTQLLLSGLALLPLAGFSIVWLRHDASAASNGLLLYALALVWVMDIGAYFSGKRFGKRKLSPLISPGKTWEGVYGGITAACILLVIALLFSFFPGYKTYALVVASVLAAAVSVIGDLFESRIKRASGYKDSSQLLPGHGGVLDRIDGVIASLPVFAFLWAWL